jgi:hypothetical protein
MLHNVIMNALAERVDEAQEWDEPPAVLLVFVLGHAVTLVRLNVPDSAWGGPGGAAAGLELVAETVGHLRMRPRADDPHGTLQGVAFLHEGWEVIGSESPGYHETRQIESLVVQRRLREHPDAREMRAIVAVDRSGNVYQVKHVRGEIGTTRLLAFPGGDAEPAGVIVEALDYIVYALTGAPRQQRPSAIARDTRGMN